MQEVYLDYAAATPLDPRVREAMEPYLSDEYGNPSSIHAKGRVAKEAVEQARQKVADILRCRKDEIIFTSGGTEADNMAILGVARHFKKGRIIVSAIEHHSVLRPCEQLRREGWAVDYISVDQDGIVDLKKLRAFLREDTVLVSVMYANNEIGTIQPVAEIGKIIKEHRAKFPAESKARPDGRQVPRQKRGSPRWAASSKFPIFHTDAAQAAGFLDLNAQRLGFDLTSMNGGKIYGPKGVGALFVRHGISLEPLIYGGGQEKGLRSGTENVAGIVGFAKALEIAQHERAKETERLTVLRDYFISRLLKEIPEAMLNGHPTQRLPNNINISIPGVEGEALVVYLDTKGVYCSTGSACSSVSLEPSHVILALGRSKEYAVGSLRFTLGRFTTKDEIDYVMEVLPYIVVTLGRGKAVQFVGRTKEKSLR